MTILTKNELKCLLIVTCYVASDSKWEHKQHKACYCVLVCAALTSCRVQEPLKFAIMVIARERVGLRGSTGA